MYSRGDTIRAGWMFSCRVLKECGGCERYGVCDEYIMPLVGWCDLAPGCGEYDLGLVSFEMVPGHI